MKRKTVSSLKKAAWKFMSEYVRLRDCLETTGTLEWGRCYTCNTRYPFKELQAGHLLDGRCGENFLDERGIMAQCMACNVWKHGNKEEFIPKFIDEYGNELFEELMKEKRTPKRWTIGDLEEKIAYLKDQIAYIKQL